MSKISQKRHNMVRLAISEVFEDLMTQKDLKDITVQDIIDEAEISRSMFYKYFQDKYDLSLWRLRYMADSLMESDFNDEEGVTKVLEEISKHRDYYKKLINYTGQNSFEEYYYEMTFSITNEVNKNYGRILNKEDTYVVVYHCFGILNIFLHWLKDPNPLPVEKIAEIITANRSEWIRAIYRQ